MTAQNILASFRKIRVKAAAFVLLLVLLTTAALYTITQRIMSQHIMNEVLRRGESLGRSMASTAGYSIFSQDLLGLDNLVYKIKRSNADIEYIAVIDNDGAILVHNEVNRTGERFRAAEGASLRRTEDGTSITDVASPAGGSFEVRSPIVFMKKSLGAVVLGINKSVLLAAQQETRKKIVIVFASIFLASMAGSLLLSSFLTRPIRELATGVAELKEGKQSRPLRVYSGDELGRLTESFNEMTALITAQRDKLSKSAQDLEEAYVSTVRVLAAAIDARDNYTLGHSTRVAKLSVELGKDLGLNRDQLEELEIACLFHDVGKIKIPDSILMKRGRLDRPELQEMMRHTEYGTEILSKAPSLFRYIPAVRNHHEWYDGSGYPDGLAGDKIPLAAAIMSLADVYDAMTSDRPYRNALSEENARRQIADLAGKQFNPDLASRFIRVLERRPPEASRRSLG